jgi:antitoxin component YwqK of YwqJK toxin-antitoxin module
MYNVFYARQDRVFDAVKDSVVAGLVDVSFVDNMLDAGTIWRIRVDTSGYAQDITDCDSTPCWIETTDTEDPDSWTFPRKFYHGNGQLEREWVDILVDGRFKKHGMYRRYYSGGQLHQEIECDKGTQVGQYRKWHSNGQLEIEGRNVHANSGRKPFRDGIWTYWDSTGREYCQGVFDSGTGEVHMWYADSSPWKAEFWKDGQDDSVWHEWYQSGAVKIVNDRRSHSDSAGERLYSPTGRLDNKARDWYANGQMRKENGREFYWEWYSDGTKKVESVRIPVPNRQRPTYTRHGKHTEWYSDGSVSMTGQYDGGYRAGVWTELSRDGIKLAEQAYAERDTVFVYNATAVLTTFHDNGQPASRGESGDPLNYNPTPTKNGKWEYWNTEGQLIRTEEWVGGIILYLDGVRTIP